MGEAEIKECFMELTENSLAMETGFETLSAPRSNSSLRNKQF
jgi:hypothetical protein